MFGLSSSRTQSKTCDIHGHDWYACKDEQHYEDSAVYVYETCEYVEITGSTTSYSHDETFYETGVECDATLYHRFDLTGIERLHGLRDQHEDFAETLCAGRDDVLDAYDTDHTLVEEIEQRAAERLCGDADGPPEVANWISDYRIDTSTHHITVEVPHSQGRTFEYRLTYEHTEKGVE